MRLPEAVPTWVGEFDVAGAPCLKGAVAPIGERHRRAKVLIREQGTPLGFVTVSADEPGRLTDLVLRAAQELAEEVRASEEPSEARGGGPSTPAASVPAPAEAITVVVCTRDRPASLEECLGRLRELRFPSFEVVVVDNAPSDVRARSVFQRRVGADRRFRYVIEPSAGLSNARNRGVHEARSRLVAFVDDDVLVDSLWLTGIASGFSRDADVACVTGFIAPAELDTSAQHYFDRRAAWPMRTGARVFDGQAHSGDRPWYPFSAGAFGAGANFAVDREFALASGGFDPALGAGTPTGGGEDLDMFLRVILAGRKIAYQPSAIVWHVHRATDVELRRQLRAWGTGLSAYLTKQLFDDAARRAILARLDETFGTRRWRRRRSGSGAIGTKSLRGLTAVELQGMFLGPAIYLLSRRRVARRAACPSGPGSGCRDGDARGQAAHAEAAGT